MGSSGHMITWYPMVRYSVSTKAQQQTRSCFAKGRTLPTRDSIALLQNSRYLHYDFSVGVSQRLHRLITSRICRKYTHINEFGSIHCYIPVSLRIDLHIIFPRFFQIHISKVSQFSWCVSYFFLCVPVPPRTCWDVTSYGCHWMVVVGLEKDGNPFSKHLSKMLLQDFQAEECLSSQTLEGRLLALVRETQSDLGGFKVISFTRVQTDVYIQSFQVPFFVNFLTFTWELGKIINSTVVLNSAGYTTKFCVWVSAISAL